MNCPLDIIEDPWPENDEHLRKYRWRDSEGNERFYDNDAGSWLINRNGKTFYIIFSTPTARPWTRIKEYEMSSDYIRIINPSEIKVGMVIEWDRVQEFTVRCKVTSVDVHPIFDGAYYYINKQTSQLGIISDSREVRVISEPEIIQPEEPTSFGACVVVNGIHFIRYMAGTATNLWCGEDKSATNWDKLCSMGQVEIVNEDPFRGCEDG